MLNKLRTIVTGRKYEIKNLIKIAYMQEKIDANDISYLNTELKYLNFWVSDLDRGKSKTNPKLNKLPNDSDQILKLLHDLTCDMMLTNILGERRESVLRKIATVFFSTPKEIDDLIVCLKRNIQSGNSIDQALEDLKKYVNVLIHVPR